jgi:hypothetical protein
VLGQDVTVVMYFRGHPIDVSYMRYLKREVLMLSQVKLSRYRPEQAHGRSGRLRPRIFLTFGT